MTLRLSASAVPNNDAVPHSPLRPIGLPLVRHSRVYTRIVNQTPVSNHQITVAPASLWTLIDQALQGRLIPSPAHPETNNANAGWLNPSDYVPSVFFAQQRYATHPSRQDARDSHRGASGWFECVTAVARLALAHLTIGASATSFDLVFCSLTVRTFAHIAV